MQEVFLCYSIPEKPYKNLELLHVDLDQYMAYYNFEIPRAIDIVLKKHSLLFFRNHYR
jgi:hypothetical protein